MIDGLPKKNTFFSFFFYYGDGGEQTDNVPTPFAYPIHVGMRQFAFYPNPLRR